MRPSPALSKNSATHFDAGGGGSRGDSRGGAWGVAGSRAAPVALAAALAAGALSGWEPAASLPFNSIYEKQNDPLDW